LIERAVDLEPADPLSASTWAMPIGASAAPRKRGFNGSTRDNDPQPDDLKRIEEKLLNGLPDEPVTKPAENKTGQTNG
jgi:hypothetical protein